MEATQTYDAQLAEFEGRIARERKIEPGDWMPEAYQTADPHDFATRP